MCRSGEDRLNFMEYKLELETRRVMYGVVGKAGKRMENWQIVKGASKSLYFVSN